MLFMVDLSLPRISFNLSLLKRNLNTCQQMSEILLTLERVNRTLTKVQTHVKTQYTTFSKLRKRSKRCNGELSGLDCKRRENCPKINVGIKLVTLKWFYVRKKLEFVIFGLWKEIYPLFSTGMTCVFYFKLETRLFSIAIKIPISSKSGEILIALKI